MKTIYLKLFALLFLFSCTNETIDENYLSDSTNSNQENLIKSDCRSTIYYIFGRSPHPSKCQYSGVMRTDDIQIILDEPLPYKAYLSFSLQSFKIQGSSKYNFQYMICPWTMVTAKAGQREIILDASCRLPSYITCGSTTTTKSGNFRVTLDDIEYVSSNAPNVNAQPSNGANYYDIKVYRSCMGGGWNTIPK